MLWNFNIGIKCEYKIIFSITYMKIHSQPIHERACGANPGNVGVRVPMDYVCGHENAICLPELIYHHVRGCDGHRRADGNGCAPLPHAYANVYASIYMLL
jgi:hypothetical protein